MSESSGNPRDILGKIVRDAWIRWAGDQPNPKPSWLVPYDDLSESDKEADRQIAEAVLGDMNARRIYLAERKSRGILSGSEAEEFTRLQREYFDTLDRMYPKFSVDMANIDAIERRKREANAAYDRAN